MLALLLYTGCDCSYSLCIAMRADDNDKWKWFAYLLEEAVLRLSKENKGSYGKLYSGTSS